MSDKPVILRPYQRSMVAAWHEFIEGGGQRGLIVAATGVGKTTVLSQIVKDTIDYGPEMTALLVAHREELLGQLAERIGQMMPGESVSTYSGVSKCGPGARVVTGSVQSLGMAGSTSLDWLAPCLVVADECHHACFVPGTLVDDRKIEEIRGGDHVCSFNHRIGALELRKVSHVFASKPQCLLRFTLSDGQTFVCTHDHPVYLTIGKAKPDYCPAWWALLGESYCHSIMPPQEGSITFDEAGDMRGMRGDLRADPESGLRTSDLLRRMSLETPSSQGEEGLDGLRRMRNSNPLPGTPGLPQLGSGPPRKGILFGDMPRFLVLKEFGEELSGDKQEVRLCENESEQSDEEGRRPAQDESDNPFDRTLSKLKRWQRERAHGVSGPDLPGVAMADRSRGQDEHGPRKRIPELLQTRRRQFRSENQRGMRRAESSGSRQASARRKEGCLPYLVGVDRIEILEPGSDGTFGGLCPEGLVYNLEVDHNHNYFVGSGLLVHNCAQTYQNVFKRFGCYDDGGTQLLGVTATPHRLDNKRLYGGGGIFEEIVYRYDIVAAIKDGFLVDLKGYRARADFNLDGVKTVAGDYQQSELEKRVNTDPVNELAFKSWAEVAHDRPTIVFCTGVDHAHAIRDVFQANGVACEALWGDMPLDSRKAAIEGFHSGRIQVLSNHSILTEGFDAWRCSCILMLRPTQSWSLFCQMCGRGLRHLPGLIEGLGEPQQRREAIASSAKPDCTVIDIIGATSAHNVLGTPGGKTTPSIQGLFDLPECMDLSGRSVADAIEEFEQLPDIVKAAAFRRRTDFSGLSALLTQVEMLGEIGVPDEVIDAGGELYWMQVGDGHLVLDCGTKDEKNRSASITTNLIGNVELRLLSAHRDQTFPLPDDPPQAIRQAERIIKQEFFGVARLAARNAPWRSAAVTDAQKDLLMKLGIEGELVATLDRGKASAFITHLMRNREGS